MLQPRLTPALRGSLAQGTPARRLYASLPVRSPRTPSSHARGGRFAAFDSLQPFSRSYSGQGGSGDYSRHAYNLRFALVPVLLGLGGTSTLWLDSPHDHGTESKHSLQAILDNVEKPDADEFLIAVSDKDDPDDDAPPAIPNRGLLLVRSVRRFLRDYLVEPISTSLRFFQLALIFLPVLLSAPILCLELVDDSRDRRRGRPQRTKERRTTRWWYYLLVHQMEMAGPTFIKVRPLSAVAAAVDKSLTRIR